MKVAFIHPGKPAGDGTGATHSATQIIDGLLSQEHDVTVYCTDELSATDEYRQAKLVDLSISRSCTSSYYGQINKAIKSRVQEFDQYDVVHSYLMRTIPSIAEVAQQTSAATVITLNAYGGVCPKNDLRYRGNESCNQHGPLRCINCIYSDMSDLPRKRRSNYFYHTARMLYHTARQYSNFEQVHKTAQNHMHIDGYHALTPQIKSTYVNFGFPCEKIAPIPNIIDRKFYTRHQSDFSEPFRLLYVGSLKKQKGVDKLLPLLNRLSISSDKEFTLTIVGKGIYKEEIEAQISELSLEERVSLKGFIPNDDLPEVYASHDIFVFPGRWDEPFGRVFIEALASGTPIVSSNVGSIKDIIGSGGIVTGGSIDSLGKSILDISNQTTLQEISEAAVEQSTKYTSQQVLEDIEQLYKKAALP